MQSEANRRLDELNGLSLIVPDIDRFIVMHVVKEAQTSSRIEGTETGMDEALQDDLEAIAPENRDDWQKVRNYITAMNQALEQLHELQLSNKLLRSKHRPVREVTHAAAQRFVPRNAPARIQNFTSLLEIDPIFPFKFTTLVKIMLH